MPEEMNVEETLKEKPQEEDIPVETVIPHKRKPSKPEEKPEDKKLILGKPKKQPPETEPDINLKKKQGELPPGVTEEIHLKPFDKDKPKEEEVPKDLSVGQPKPFEHEREVEEVQPELPKPDTVKKSKKVVKKPKDKGVKEDKLLPQEEQLEREVLKPTVVDDHKEEVEQFTKKPEEEVEKPEDISEKPEQKLEKSEKKPTKPKKEKFEEIKPVESFTTVKLRKSTVKPREDKTSEAPKVLLKSLIKRIPVSYTHLHPFCSLQ